ncbi:MAG: glycosyltransferase [Pirellulales bacterium]|nr:glycosyltransferase [Pirellulales bacterium]
MFVITSMPVGGAETLLVNMMRKMDLDQVRPEVVCLKQPGPLGQQLAAEFPVHSNLLSGKWDLRVLPRLACLMHRRRADVVVTVGAGDKMFWGRLAAHLAGVPVIASALHSTGWPDGVGKMNRWLTGITDAFIAVADSHGQFLREFERFPADKVHVIRNGVDCQRFCPDREARDDVRRELGVDANTTLVGIVAALRSEKNHLMLVRAAARLKNQFPQARWVIIGDGPQRGKIEHLARELGVSDRLLLLGTRHDTPRLVSALDVFTLCSLNEASPVSILEALACQVPVVATDVGSVSESVVAGKTGYLVPSQHDSEYADAIGRLLGDADLRRVMGQCGRQRVLQRSSLEAMVEGYQNLAFDLYDQRVWSPTAVPSRRQPRATAAARR